MRTINLQNGAVGIIYVTAIIDATTLVLVITITKLENWYCSWSSKQHIINTTAICNPSDKSINTTESKICVGPVTVKPH